jgi:hypothetical protein
MKQGKSSLLVVLAAVGIIVILLLIYKAYNRPMERNRIWQPNYSTSGFLKNEPYSLGKLYQLFKKRNGAGKLIPISEPLFGFLANRDKSRPGVYVCIGYQPYFTDTDIEAIIEFLEEGNTMFLAVNLLPSQMMKRLSIITEGEVWEGTSILETESVKVALTDQDPPGIYRFTHQYEDTILPFPWRYYTPESLQSSAIRCSIKEYINDSLPSYLAVKVGKGELLLQTNPIFYTNFFLVKPEGYRYVSQVFAFISPDTDVWFDHYSLDPENPSPDRERSESWLGFVLKSPGLQWAWGILLLMAFLFVTLRSRRKQRPIPVHEPNLNSVMGYMQAISNIYLKNRDHRAFALQMHQLWLRRLSIRYGINLHQDKNDLIGSVVMRAGASENSIRNIFEKADFFENQKKIFSRQLMEFHRLIFRFNQQIK